MCRFQSAPGAEAGRNSSVGFPRIAVPRFNPLPALRPGGTLLESGDLGGEVVSIRSRRSGREERQSSVTELSASVFQSAPGAEAGRNANVVAMAAYDAKVSIRSRR